MSQDQPNRLTAAKVADFAREMRVEPKDYYRLLDTFLSKNEERLAELATAIEKQDTVTAHRVVHSIKGTSSTLRLDWMAAIAARLEAAVQLGDFSSFPEDLISLRQGLEQIRKDAELMRDEARSPK